MRPLAIAAPPLVALMLVTAAWVYGPLAHSGSSSSDVSAPSSAEAVPPAGFRADAWFLPDEELLGFVEIPAGPFLMGSDPEVDPQAFDNERWADGTPRQEIELAAYFIGRYEVTVGQFKAFVDATGRRVADETLRAPLDHPVASVSWPDALAYARWLEARLKAWPETPAPLARALAAGWRVTLPTEAEWEKAARGSDGRIFPWGSEPRRDRANYAAGGTVRVGSIPCPECPFGLADMSGSVWEWTRTPYRPVLVDPAEAVQDLEADALWVMRGGSFGDPPRNVRAGIRGGADPGVRRPFIGFRVVISRL